MIERQVTIINKLGLHARAAAKFVSLASQFKSDVELVNDHQRVNGKSIMGVMMLAAARGTALTMCVNGADEQVAADQLEALIADRFGESE
ncbi:MAG: HPr family phosphocarrier protein [Gammaproteobacteria bacterium]|nr:HPr family phosphocarrier protein [Gammaproteobacteria bacterium]